MHLSQNYYARCIFLFWDDTYPLCFQLQIYFQYQLHTVCCVSLILRNISANNCRSQWPRGLRRRSAAARLLRSWVRIPPGAWMFVCCECCVLSGRGLCDELITRPEESYRLWCVVACDLETSRMRRPWPALGRSATAKKKKSKVPFVYLIITMTQ